MRNPNYDTVVHRLEQAGWKTTLYGPKIYIKCAQGIDCGYIELMAAKWKFHLKRREFEIRKVTMLTF